MKGSLDKGLVFGRSEFTTFGIVGYLNSDYFGHPNCGHSITGYIFILCVHAIS